MQSWRDLQTGFAPLEWDADRPKRNIQTERKCPSFASLRHGSQALGPENEKIYRLHDRAAPCLVQSMRPQSSEAFFELVIRHLNEN